MKPELRNYLVMAVLSACALTPAPVVTSQAAPASTGSLLQFEDLHYQGAFRLPQIEQLQYGGASAAFHDGQLLVQGRGNVFFDFSVPTPLKTSDYFELPQAALVRRFDTGLDNGLRLDKNPSDTQVRGLLFVGPKLLMTVASYYDAANAQLTSHVRRDWQSGLVTAHALKPVGHTAGYMTLSTGELAPALTGNFGLPIVSRESYGPAAFIFDPETMSRATPVLDYPGDHPLGPWNGQSDVWNSDSRLGGMHQIGRSLLFVGVHGTGPFCYGEGNCGDKESNDHGSHTYPYTPRIWAYDTADLVAVKRRQKKPWQPRPYGLWNVALPLSSGRTRIASAIDSATHRLFILQGFGDRDPANGFPVVHVYTVASGPGL